MVKRCLHSYTKDSFIIQVYKFTNKMATKVMMQLGCDVISLAQVCSRFLLSLYVWQKGI